MTARAPLVVSPSDWYPDRAAELVYAVFTAPECLDALAPDKIQRVAVCNDDVVGFIAWRRAINYLYWDLSWLAVDGDWRGRGVGRVLVEYLKAHVIQYGGSAIRLETPEDSDARPFYERCGFELAHVYPDYYDAGRGTCVYTWRNPSYRLVTVPESAAESEG